MGLKACKEYGKQVSSKAPSCPNCGVVIKRKTNGCVGCFAIMIFGFFGLAILGAMIGTDSSSDVTSRTTSARLPESQTPNAEGDSDSSSDNTSRTTSAPLPESQTLYAEGDSVHVGYTTYSVWGSWWSTTLSDNQFINEAPNAMYLFVDLTVRNDDKKARTVPPFTLVDENDANTSRAVVVPWLMARWVYLNI
ncbi:MAG: DUF4352 domain-containing protein [Candidatus Hydrogenedentota bacterium]